MSKKRVATIRALVRGSVLAGAPAEGELLAEATELQRAQRARGRRRDLLALLHTTRLLDTALRELILAHGIPLAAGQRSLGAYLHVLENHVLPTVGRLPNGRAGHYQLTVVNPRNTAMHEANHWPPNHVVAAVQSEMESCLSEVTAL